MSTSVPDNLVSVINPAGAVPDAQPKDSILFLAQMMDALNKIPKNSPEWKLANNQLRFYRMAASILTSSSKEEEFIAIRTKFGTDLDGVLALAEMLKQVAEKKNSEIIIDKVVSTAKVDLGDGDKPVKDQLTKTSVFGF